LSESSSLFTALSKVSIRCGFSKSLRVHRYAFPIINGAAKNTPREWIVLFFRSIFGFIVTERGNCGSGICKLRQSVKHFLFGVSSLTFKKSKLSRPSAISSSITSRTTSRIVLIICYGPMKSAPNSRNRLIFSNVKKICATTSC